MLATAQAQPDTLAIGIDASAEAMAEASRRAAKPATRGGLPNALFVVAAAEALPAELDGLADAVTVHFPWGSLLRGVLCAEPAIGGGIARIMRLGASLSMLVSVTEHDQSAGLPPLSAAAFAQIAAVYARHGLALTEARPATADDLAASHSTWAKRLKAGDARPVWRVGFERCGAAPSPSPSPAARERGA